MKRILFFVMVFAVFNSYGQKQMFSIPNLNETIGSHKTVAILPFRSTISYKKQPKNFSAEANRDQEVKMAKSIQSSMYTFLLRKSETYSVSFQDIDRTNILLKRAGIDEKLDETTKEEIAKILGVDAVISGTFEQEQSKTEAGAIASAVLFGGLGGKTGSGTLTMTINNGANGDLMWRFMKTMDDNIASSTDDLIENMMRKVSRNFPYLKP